MAIVLLVVGFMHLPLRNVQTGDEKQNHTHKLKLTLQTLLFGFKVRDINSKPKIIRRDKYELLHLTSDDWFADAEIIIRARELGLKIGETPVHFVANDARGSFVKPTAILEFASNLFKYRFRRHDEPKPASLPRSARE